MSQQHDELPESVPRASGTKAEIRAKDIRITWCPIGMPFANLQPPSVRGRSPRRPAKAKAPIAPAH